jgi:hypothetical protein
MTTQNYNTLKNSSVLIPATSSDLGSVTQPYGNLFLAGNLTLGGNQATITATSTIVPKIGNIVYANSTTAANPTGGETITLTGSGFLSGAGVYIANTLVPVSTVANSNAITFTSPVQAAGNYPLGVINTDGGTATFLTGIVYSNVPIWTTSAGTLGTFQEGNTIANTLAATDGALTITYSVTSGSLPGGLSLGSANGNITGTLSNVTSGSSVTYNFTVGAADPANQIVTRNFSYTVSGDTVTWSSPTNGTNKSIVTGGAISNIGLSATSTFGRTVTYGATCLPTGLSICGANIVGTPTVAGTKTATIYANTNTKSSSITVNFTVNNPFVAATGGTITTVGNYKIHTFNSSGAFTVTTGGTVQYVAVAGGGGAGGYYGGGGGAGGLLTGCTTVTAHTYTICVGAGGGPGGSTGCNGSNSAFNTNIAIGGGGGGSGCCMGYRQSARSGGSGGGAGGAVTYYCIYVQYGACGTPGQGNKGGADGTYSSNHDKLNTGGGGGAGGVGGDGGYGAGGGGLPNPITGSTAGQCVSGTYYLAGGGAGKNYNQTSPVPGGKGGGGHSSYVVGCFSFYASASGAVNTGGGGGAAPGGGGGFGGSGVVVIKYQYQ